MIRFIKSSQGFGLIGILIVIAVIALAGGGGFYWSETKKQQSFFEAGADAIKRAEELKKQIESRDESIYGGRTSIDSDGDTSDWKTYRNEKYGFEFKYPLNWIKAHEEDDSRTGLSVTFGESPNKKTQAIFNLKVFRGSVEEKLSKISSDTEKRNTNINGMNFVAISQEYLGYQNSDVFYLQHNEFVFHFFVGFIGQPGDRELLDSIHKSFRLLN